MPQARRFTFIIIYSLFTILCSAVTNSRISIPQTPPLCKAAAGCFAEFNKCAAALLVFVHLLVILLVVAAGHVVHPLFVGQVPVNGQHNALLERGFGVPAQIVLDLGGVNAVTAVMAQAVRHVLDQLFADALVLQAVMQLLNDSLDDEAIQYLPIRVWYQ